MDNSARALGTIVDVAGPSDRVTAVYCGLLDYYDHWSSVDPRLLPHNTVLSSAASSVGHDLVNIATYVHEILGWLAPDRIALSPSVVVVGGMTEAFLASLRSAYDAVGSALAYVARDKVGQAPSTSLAKLASWARKNPSRVRPSVGSLIASDLKWFWQLRRYRDLVLHNSADSVIHCDTRQFNLWLFAPNRGWVTREPLLPFLASQVQAFLRFSDSAAEVINSVISLPADRIHSREVEGVLVPSLHRLVEIAAAYAAPSP